MYPIKVKECNYNGSIFDYVNDIIDFMLFSIKSFRTPKSLMIFLEKSFHF